MIRRFTLKPAALPARRRAEVLRLVAAAVHRGPARAAAPQPDRFQFTLEVKRGGKLESFTFQDDAVPAELQALFELAANQPK